MKYQSELIKEIIDTRGHKKSSLHYESECVETWIAENKGAYPKLCDYESEWLNYISILDDMGGSKDPEPPIGEFPYVVLSDVTEATIDNVVPYAYRSAILKGQTLVNVLNPETINFDGVSNLKMDGGNFTYDVDWEWGKFAYIIKGKPNTSYLIKHSEKSDGTYILFRRGDDMHLSTFTDIEEKNQVVTTDGSGQFVISIEAEIVGTDFIIQNLMVFEYQQGMENWDIPYFTGIQSVRMPVLTTSNGDGTKTIILSTSEDVELRGIGQGSNRVEDELDCLTGEVTERIGEIVLDGTQDMASDGYGVYIQVNDAERFLDYTDKIACDKLPVIPTHTELENVENGISGYASGSYLGENWLYVKINNSVNADEIKEWLTQNPITVQYQLATESIKTVALKVINQDGENVSLRPIEGTMHLSTSSETIKPLFSGEIPVESITQNLASFIEEE